MHIKTLIIDFVFSKQDLWFQENYDCDNTVTQLSDTLKFRLDGTKINGENEASW